MYYETDGDSGFYAIKLFTSEKKAETYKLDKNSAYGVIKKVEIT
jgi:hypothetical protein